MASQTTSTTEFFDLTADEDSPSDAEASVPTTSAAARPERVPHISPNRFPTTGGALRPRAEQNGASQPAENDSDVEMLEDIPLDEAVRRQNVERRRERLLARGIQEENGGGGVGSEAGHRRRESVTEVIVISDGDDSSDENNLNSNNMGNSTLEGDGDIFGEERRRRRRWNIWADDLEDRLRHPNCV